MEDPRIPEQRLEETPPWDPARSAGGTSKASLEPRSGAGENSGPGLGSPSPRHHLILPPLSPGAPEGIKPGPSSLPPPRPPIPPPFLAFARDEVAGDVPKAGRRFPPLGAPARLGSRGPCSPGAPHTAPPKSQVSKAASPCKRGQAGPSQVPAPPKAGGGGGPHTWTRGHLGGTPSRSEGTALWKSDYLDPGFLRIHFPSCSRVPPRGIEVRRFQGRNWVNWGALGTQIRLGHCPGRSTVLWSAQSGYQAGPQREGKTVLLPPRDPSLPQGPPTPAPLSPVAGPKQHYGGLQNAQIDTWAPALKLCPHHTLRVGSLGGLSALGRM